MTTHQALPRRNPPRYGELRPAVRRQAHALGPILLGLLALACNGGDRPASPAAATITSHVANAAGQPPPSPPGEAHSATSPASASARPTATVAEPIGGLLLITRNEALVLRDTATGEERQLLAAPQGVLVAYPAWAPDRSKFAFTLVHPFAGRVNGVVADWGSDLYIATSSGDQRQELLRHDAPGVQFQALSWTPDGAALLFTYLSFTYDANGQFAGQNEQIRRLDLATGALTTVLEDAAGSDLCSGGNMLAFTRTDPLTNTGRVIVVAAADGGNPRTIITASTAIQNFLYPRFSPDCSRLVFAASGSSALQQPEPGKPLVLAYLRGATAAHGPPSEIWTINVDGTGLRRLTHVGEDEPYPVWSPDGMAIFVLGVNALYRLTPDDGDVTRIAAGTVLGQLSLR